MGIAMLSQAGWLASADDGWTANQGLVQNGIPTAPAFEEETQHGSATRYSWRNRNIEAKLDFEGGISFRFPDGRQLRITFTGAKPGVKPQGEAASYPVSYYLASSRFWHSGVRWERVRYREIYPGIDLVLVTNAGQLEYKFEIRPEADPGRIRIRYHGATVRLNQHGDLVIRAGRNQIRQRRAFAFQGAFQGDNVETRTVQCSYHLKQNRVTLRLGRYDRRRTLIIDPVLNFSTYLGGLGYDVINALAADSAGDIYVTGATSSTSLLPGSTPSVRASRAVWVAKLNSSGTQLLYLVYLGGSGNDSGTGIAVDPLGNSYVTGTTTSTDFPTTSGAFSTKSAGPQEAFVAKIGSIGQVQYSTYLGGGSDAGSAIAVDNTGAVYVAGQTASVSFPTTAGAIKTSYQGGLSDCYVSKLNVAGSSLLYSTFLGGSALDLCTGIAIDTSGDAYVTGTTYSTNFPTQLALQSNLTGTASAFVAEINATGSALLYSTYLGGSVVDNGNAIAVDSSGSAYIVGSTASPDFPTTTGAAQTVLEGLYNAFVSKLAPGGNGFSYSTLIGGAGSDSATAVAIDSLGQAVAGGFTTSSNFPAVNAIQAAFQGTRDAFASVVSASGSSLVFSSYFGGSGDDRAFAVAALPNYNLALGGLTNSTNFPTAAAFQSSFGGTYDGFVLSAQYETVVTTPPPAPAPASVSPGAGIGTTQTFTLTFEDPNGYANLSVVDVLINNFLNGIGACYLAFVPSGASSGSVFLVDNAGDAGGPYSGMVLPGTGMAQNGQCTVSGTGSSVSASGNTLTLTLAVTFASTFDGNKVLYMAAGNDSQNSGWQALGTWDVPGPAPTGPAVAGVTPARSSTTGQTYTFTFTDTNGYADLAVLDVVINNSLNGVGACYLAFAPSGATSGSLYLVDDAGDGNYASGSPISVPSSSSVKNSQCTISGAGSSVSASSDMLTLNLAITFSSSFAGNQVFYVAARNNSTGNSGWQAVGSITVP
jgi:Beta-propeller repeat